jgi:hypothetical protein
MDVAVSPQWIGGVAARLEEVVRYVKEPAEQDKGSRFEHVRVQCTLGVGHDVLAGMPRAGQPRTDHLPELATRYLPFDVQQKADDIEDDQALGVCLAPIDDSSDPPVLDENVIRAVVTM